MDIVQIIEIVALVMGIPYMIFEVLQKNTMWYFGFFTSTACAIQFFLESNWANMGLNIYYVGMAFWGLYKWKKDSAAVEADIHLTRFSPKMAATSAAIFILGSGLQSLARRDVDHPLRHRDALARRGDPLPLDSLDHRRHLACGHVLYGRKVLDDPALCRLCHRLDVWFLPLEKER